jgi:alpha-beta hydrolase superfamily lysophospholipase
MHRTTRQKLKQYLLWIIWILIIQIALANISAAIYAYKFTHFYSNPPPYQPTKNVFVKTWKLFTGPRIYKLPIDSTTPSGYEKIKLRTNNDLSIDGWYSPADSAKGCIIFFHGITNNKALFLNEANECKAWGYNVLLIYFRAHGNSEVKKRSFVYKETDEAEKEFRFAQAKGNKNIIVYGNSLGSVVVMKATAEKKISPSAIIADMPFASLQDHLKARARVLGFPSQPFAFLVTLWIGIQNGYNGFGLRTYEYAKKIDCPVLLQWGDKDIYVTEKEINQVYQNLKSPNKKLIVYTGANHESLLKYDPINWQKNVSGFISALSH